jgi:hypothetical protein
MDINLENVKEKTAKLDSFQKIFLISNVFEEPKDKKNWFKNQFQDRITSIKQEVDTMKRDARFARLRKRLILNSNINHQNYLTAKKSNLGLTSKIGHHNKLFIKKNNSNKNDIPKNNSSINLDDHNEQKLKNRILNINTTNIIKSISKDTMVEDNNNNFGRNRNNFKYKINITALPQISGVENKSKYLKTNIENISEQTDLIEKELMLQEKRKYARFKSRYNSLLNKAKKNQININQFMNPQNQYKFKLNSNKGQNEATLVNLKKVMKQISNKVKNKFEEKPTIPDIIDEVENFKIREKRLRDRITKSHKKFEYLINDSNIIQKRIETKY